MAVILYEKKYFTLSFVFSPPCYYICLLILAYTCLLGTGFFLLSSDFSEESFPISKSTLNPFNVFCPSYLFLLSLSCARFFAPPWTIACQDPLSMGFPRQEYWFGMPFPPLVDLPDPGIEPESSALQADSLLSEPPGSDHNLFLRGYKNFVENRILILFNFNL